jgi:hypothetical protein
MRNFCTRCAKFGVNHMLAHAVETAPLAQTSLKMLQP